MRDRAEAAAQAAVRPNVIDGYRDRFDEVEAALDLVIEKLSQLEDWRTRAENLGFKGLPWIVAGGMSVAALQHWKDVNRTSIDQLT